jgi:biopolymer transport protein ExbB/TolQ
MININNQFIQEVSFNMDILNLMQSALYLIMNALLYPVIGLLIILVVAVLFISGSFAAEFVGRRGRRAGVDRDSEQLAARIAEEMMTDEFNAAADQVENHLGRAVVGSRQLTAFLRDFAVEITKGRERLDVRAEKVLQQHEMQIAGALDKTRVMIRIAPMLGLMGTLIPMGPALLALTSGDLKQMANSLIIAFGTTVSGLAVAVAAYLISMIRDRWYAQDIRDMEYVIDLVLDQIASPGSVAVVAGGCKAAVLPMVRGAQ